VTLIYRDTARGRGSGTRSAHDANSKAQTAILKTDATRVSEVARKMYRSALACMAWVRGTSRSRQMILTEQVEKEHLETYLSC
jgi:hypothetical protein